MTLCSHRKVLQPSTLDIIFNMLISAPHTPIVATSERNQERKITTTRTTTTVRKTRPYSSVYSKRYDHSRDNSYTNLIRIVFAPVWYMLVSDRQYCSYAVTSTATDATFTLSWPLRRQLVTRTLSVVFAPVWYMLVSCRQYCHGHTLLIPSCS